mmetsp:Transcript_515/g.1457  ORF Transcript_515/g.1457 Transcript_515/m.1457 type:complete len:152 (+) Transcript_515:2852-3307(+)
MATALSPHQTNESSISNEFVVSTVCENDFVHPRACFLQFYDKHSALHFLSHAHDDCSSPILHSEAWVSVAPSASAPRQNKFEIPRQKFDTPETDGHILPTQQQNSFRDAEKKADGSNHKRKHDISASISKDADGYDNEVAQSSCSRRSHEE